MVRLRGQVLGMKRGTILHHRSGCRKGLDETTDCGQGDTQINMQTPQCNLSPDSETLDHFSSDGSQTPVLPWEPLKKKPVVVYRPGA